MPLIQDLKNPAMRDRHWAQIKSEVQKPFDQNGKYLPCNNAVLKSFLNKWCQIVAQKRTTCTVTNCFLSVFQLKILLLRRSLSLVWISSLNRSVKCLVLQARSCPLNKYVLELRFVSLAKNCEGSNLQRIQVWLLCGKNMGKLIWIVYRGYINIITCLNQCLVA